MTEKFRPEYIPEGTFKKEGDLKGQRLGGKEKIYTEEDLAKAKIAEKQVITEPAQKIISKRIDEIEKFLGKKI